MKAIWRDQFNPVFCAHTHTHKHVRARVNMHRRFKIKKRFLKTAIWGRFRPNWRICWTLRCFACWLCTYWAASPAPPANPAFPVRPLAQTAGHANPLSPLMFSREEKKKKPNRVLCFSRSIAPPCGVWRTEDLLHWYLSGKQPQAE